MNRLLTALLVSMLFVIVVSGCQEDNSRQANLIGTENLRLQLKEKDTKIASLQSELDKCTEENTTLKAQATKSAEGFMQMFIAANQKTVTLEKENAALKAKIKELEK